MTKFLLAAATLLFFGSASAENIQLVFAGDIMLDDGPGRFIAAGGDPFAAFAKELSSADYAIGNLECPVAESGTANAEKIVAFRANPRVIPLLKKHFDAVALANNHSGDYGKTAFVETMAHLDAAGIRRFGGGHDLREAHAPLWIDKNGLRIAVLSYNEYKPRAFEASPDRPGIAWSEDSQVLNDIRAARKAGADLIIPFMHWGWERETTPTERQRTLARRMIDAGADVVVGGHPHVTQGAEYYKGHLIVYSLGNFVFDGFDYPEAKLGWLLRLTLDRQGLVSWETLAAHMDEDGTPHTQTGDATPCGDRQDVAAGQAIRQCINRPMIGKEAK